LGASGVTLSFSGLIDGTMLAAPIAGLALGDVLQVTSSQYVMASSTAISGANTILNLLGAQGTIGSLLLADTTLTASVADTALTTGGYAVSLTAALPCYAAGTRIAIPGGEAPVETLKPGALVMTASGSCVPVRWVGHRHVTTSGHPSPEQLWPVRISPGAFADGRPRSDLFLSPDHAVWEAGVLLLARDLINGSSIMQVPMDQLTYWHIELDRHNLLLAEGLAAESYLDSGNRDSFAGGGEGKCRPRATAPYAERVLEGPLLSAVKARLFYRARCAPPPPSAPPALVADGIALPVLQKTPELWRAALPAAYHNIALVSSAWVPAEHFAPSLDRRRLGVRLFGAWADEQALPLDGPAFAAGFYPTEITAEGACRWTNGTGRFDLPRGAHTLTLRLEPHPAG
jgi:hypothetical protein